MSNNKGKVIVSQLPPADLAEFAEWFEELQAGAVMTDRFPLAENVARMLHSNGTRCETNLPTTLLLGGTN